MPLPHRPVRRSLTCLLTASALLAGALLAAPVVGDPSAGPSGSAAFAASSASSASSARQEADRLRSEATRQQDDVRSAEDRLAELAAASNAALERYERAEQALDVARADHWTQSERLAHAQDAAARSRGDLGRWAAQAYRSSGGTDLDGVVQVLRAEDAEDLQLRLITLERLGRVRDAALTQAADAQEVQDDAARQAEDSARAALELAAAADEARLESERLVAEQRALVTTLAERATSAADAAARADAEAARLEQARALVAGQPAVTADLTQSVTGAVGECRGGDLRGYANGTIPASALCPVWGASGHLLRADAAYAFEQLAKAYAAEFGAPVCVTDSYRSYEAQVRVKASKPRLAATPGTSNHGWGKALDLCGGIQRFGTPEHRWMQVHAPLHGWFNPGWAQQNGTKPEPWHWEFAG
ncbi:D-alanyl-D-alanine carboxypeptidase family protein [Thalassiella azotivora]